MGDGMKDTLASNSGIEIHSKDFCPGLKEVLYWFPCMKCAWLST